MPQIARAQDGPNEQMTGDRHRVVRRIPALEDPATDDGHVIEYNIGKDRAGGRRLGATVRLMQGHGDAIEPGVEISRFRHDDLQPNVDVIRQPIPPADAARITDYGDLQLVVDFERGIA